MQHKDTIVLENQQKDIEKYRVIAKREALPLMMQPEWLDAVSGHGNWYVSLAYDAKGEAIGAMPYFKTKRYGLHVITMPPLTSRLGIWVAQPSDASSHRQLLRFQQIAGQLILGLPRVWRIYYQLEVNFHNVIPFLKNNYRQTTRYTYQVILPDDVSKISSIFNENVKRNIKKSSSTLSLLHNVSERTFYEFIQSCFQQKGLHSPCDLSSFRHLYQYLDNQQIVKILVAQDTHSQWIAACMVIYDGSRAIYLLSGQRKGSSASALYWLIAEAMSQSIRDGMHTFDFDGSMQPNIAQAFVSMGASPVPYHAVWKTRFPFLK